MKKIIIILMALALVGGGVYFVIQNGLNEVIVNESLDETEVMTDIDQPQDEEQPDEAQDVQEKEVETIIGKSVEDRNITAYHYGNGDTKLLFVGGIHGGYSWNTVLVAYEMMDYLEANPNIIPDNVEVTVIPSLNPDGQNDTVGTAGRFTKADVPAPDLRVPGRFNANNVDLNRNFDCDWQSTGLWRNVEVDGGSGVFSEPETMAIRDYVEANNPNAVVVWYSAFGGVFASNCHNGVLPETLKITNVYAEASGYPALEEFDFYEITGDMVNWLAKNDIPGISVLLTTHEDVEWDKNRAGIEALLKYYAE